MSERDFEQALTGLVAHRLDGVVTRLRRLTSGASLETWAIAVQIGAQEKGLILRRLPDGQRPLMNSVSLATEATVIALAAACGVPVATVHYVLVPDDGLGQGFIADHMPGEALPTRLLKEERYATIRDQLAYGFGEILARIHAVPLDQASGLARIGVLEQLASMERGYRSRTMRSPVFELAFRWLHERAGLGEARAERVVHGDFRLGNILVAPEGVSAVLDWELVHIGDPAEDFGWLTVNSWRFGRIGKVVGGVGDLDELQRGYRAAGGEEIDPDAVLFWRALGSLRWGVACGEMSHMFEQGDRRNMERGIIGRRVSETELDLLDIIAPETVA